MDGCNMRRKSLGNSVPVAINRYINSAYDNVLLVAENIEHVKKVADNIEYLTHYLGAYESAPSTRPDGSPLETGDFYYNDKSIFYYEASDDTWTEVDPDVLIAASEAAVLAAQVAEDAKVIAVDAADKAASFVSGTDIGDYEDDPTFNNITDYVVVNRGTPNIALFKVEENVTLPYTVDSVANPHPTDDDNLRAYTSTSTLYTYEETTYLTDGQVIVDATSELKNFVVYLWDAASGEREKLDVLYDYVTNDSNQIQLLDTYPLGSKVTIVFEDIGQSSDTYLKKIEAEQEYGDHTKQANRDTANSHPASAISTTEGDSVQGVLDSHGIKSVDKGDYAPDIELTTKYDYVKYNGKSYFATNPPYTTTATTPDNDTGNLFVGGYVHQAQAEVIATEIAQSTTLEHNLDTTSHPSLITEINTARTEDVAASRIPNNSLTSSKLSVANDGDKIKLNNLSQEVHDALSGDAPVSPTIPDNSITTQKYAPDSVDFDAIDKDLENATKYVTTGCNAVRFGTVTFRSVAGSEDVVVKWTGNSPRVYIYSRFETRFSIDIPDGTEYTLTESDYLYVDTDTETVGVAWIGDNVPSNRVVLALNLNGRIVSGELVEYANTDRQKTVWYRGTVNAEWNGNFTDVTLNFSAHNGFNKLYWVETGRETYNSVDLPDAVTIPDNTAWLYSVSDGFILHTFTGNNTSIMSSSDVIVLAVCVNGVIMGGELLPHINKGVLFGTNEAYQGETVPKGTIAPTVSVSWIRYGGFTVSSDSGVATVQFDPSCSIYYHITGLTGKYRRYQADGQTVNLTHNEMWVIDENQNAYIYNIVSDSNLPSNHCVMFICIDGNIVGGDLYGRDTRTEDDEAKHTVKYLRDAVRSLIDFPTAPNGMTIVNDELWYFGASSDESELLNGQVKRYDAETLTLISTHTHNFGHVNSVSYCAETDTMVFGNGSGDYGLMGKVWVLQNVSTWQSDTDYDKASIGIVIDLTTLGDFKTNVVWGATNNGQHNEIFILSRDLGKVQRAYLGKGSNDFSVLSGGYGTLIAGASVDEFNGTLLILDTYYNDIYTDVIQGAHYSDDGLIVATGHNNFHIWQCDFIEDSTALRLTEYRYRFVGADGTNADFGFHEGLSWKDGTYYTGIVGGSGASATNGLYKFKLQ